MFPADCPTWLNCEARMNLTDSMIWRAMVASTDAGCPALRVTGDINAEIEGGAESTIMSDYTPELVESAEAPGSKTLAGLYLAFTVWKTANPTKKAIFTPVMGGDGIPGIIVLKK